MSNAEGYDVQLYTYSCQGRSASEQSDRCSLWWWKTIANDLTGLNADVSNLAEGRSHTFRVCAFLGSQTACSNERTEIFEPVTPPPPEPPTATPTPTPTPKPLPTVQRIEYDSQPIQDGHWSVLHTSLVTLYVTGADLADYEFQIATNPAGTGFYAATHGHKCAPLGTSETAWATLHQPISLLASGSGDVSFTLVRCALGQTRNTGMEVKARVRGGTGISIWSTGELKQGWHREPLGVTYDFDATTFGTLAGTMEQETNDAADAWNAVIPSYFSPAPQGSVANVTIEVGACPGIGCTWPAGVYPHIGTQTLTMPDPPTSWARWTYNLGDAQTRNTRFIYLRSVLMHELGHTAGLGHLPEGNVMGRYTMGKAVRIAAARGPIWIPQGQRTPCPLGGRHGSPGHHSALPHGGRRLREQQRRRGA